MNAMTLHDLSAEYKTVFDDLAAMEESGEIDADTVFDTLEGIEEPLHEKALSVAAFIKNEEAMAAAIKEAIADMQSRMKAHEAKAKRVKDYLLSSLNGAGVPKVESPRFCISVKKTPAPVVIYDDVPEEFSRIKTTVDPDKTKIKAALKDGQELAFAKMGEQGRRLEIK